MTRVKQVIELGLKSETAVKPSIDNDSKPNTSILGVILILGAVCIAGDVRISAKSTVAVAKTLDEPETTWWDDVTDWVESLFD